MNKRGRVNNKKRIKGIFLLVLIIALCPVLLGAAPDHTNKFYINDYADVLSSETEEYIFETALNLDRETTAQVCVLTVETLNGAEISEYAVEVFRAWGIGDKEKDNGVLILLSIGDRKVWVTTGYGIEGTLTDTRLGALQDEYAVPYYSNNDFDTGTKELFSAIVSYIMAEEYGLEALPGYETPYYDYNEYSNDGYGQMIFGMGWMILPVALIFGAILISQIHYWRLKAYDKIHGTNRAYEFKIVRRNFILIILRYTILRGNRGGRGGGGFRGGGGGFSGGGGSSGGGGAGRSF